MKEFRILALVTMLALGFTLSAQAQTENTTGSDQYTTQSTDQTASAPAPSDNSSMFAQPSQSTASSASMSSDTDSDQNRNRVKAKPDLWESQQEADRLQEIRNDSGAN
jgi:hypothetical protein